MNSSMYTPKPLNEEEEVNALRKKIQLVAARQQAHLAEVSRLGPNT